MQPGPIIIIACPHCQGLSRRTTLLSGNTFGARLWSDGRRVAPMLPFTPPVALCGSCKRCYWLKDAREVAQFDLPPRIGQPGDPALTDAPDIEEPEEAQYLAAIEEGLANNAKELITLRTLAWWKHNDELRGRRITAGGQAGEVSPEARRSNLLKLADLLDEREPDSLVMKAEVMRALGEFEAALALLDRVKEEPHRTIAAQIKTFCEQRETKVQQLQLKGR